MSPSRRAYLRGFRDTFGRPRYARPAMRFYALSLLTLLAAVGLASCWNSAACVEGDACECSQGDECYLGCDGDGCDQRCFQMDRCGAVCEHECSFECFDVDECSASCGDNCDLECHNTRECGAICDRGCRYECHDTSVCGVSVGSSSVVTCRNVDTCAVECRGSCKVFCENVGNGNQCRVTCRDGDAPVMCPDGSRACGAC